MMKLRPIAAIVMATSLAAPVLVHAADDHDKDRGSVKAWVKDSVITTKIKSEMAVNKPTTLAKVHVDTDASGYVLLTGSANTQADKERAEGIARNVAGVTSVENKIKVTGDK